MGDNTQRKILADAVDVIRKETGLDRQPPDLGKKQSEVEVDTKLLELADSLINTQQQLPKIPKTGTLLATLAVIFVAAIIFLVTLFVVQDKPYATTVLVGEGTIFTALTGLAMYLAKTHDAAVRAYNERAANWIRTNAVVRVMQEMSRGVPLDPAVAVRLLTALREVFPPEKA